MLSKQSGMLDGILKIYFAWIYFHEHQGPKYFPWINFGEKSKNSRNFIYVKVCPLGQRNAWAILILFDKQLGYLIQTNRDAVLKLNSFFLLLIITLCFTCGERKISSTIKKPQDVININASLTF